MRKKLLSTCLEIIIIVCLTGCGKSDVYESHNKDYTQITSVQGVSFDMPSFMLSQATAISAIFQNEEYTGAYVYRDGESKYIMFDMEQIVVSCGRTDFDFQGNENEETLESDDIEGVWMSKAGEKFSYSKDNTGGIYKIMADVNAEFSVTPNQYGEYVGKMASISTEGQEWSIFAGAKAANGTLSKSQDKIIGHIVKSFAVVQNIPGITADIHNPIELGKWSNASGQDPFGRLETGYVRVDSVITGKEAADFVQKYGKYKNAAMEGTSFEVVEYSTTIDPKRAYLDVRFEGVDGESLKFRGASYTTRTYDALSLTEEKDGVYTKMYAYYEVPTGCKEYLLEFGLQIREISLRETCCYLQTVK